MASISSSTSFSASRGLSGLVSGLDTEGMVEKLLAGTQAKIDKQNATKQQLIWKQDSYRNVISLLTGVQDKFLNYLNPSTNLLSNSFFNAMSATSKSEAVKVSAGNTASAGKVTIKKVTQLATAAKYESGDGVSSDLELKIDAAKLPKGEAAIDITLDGIKKTIRFNGGDAAAIRSSLEQGIKSAFGSSNIQISEKDGKLLLTAANPSSQITVSSTAEGNNGLEVLGLKPWQSNKVNTTAALKNLNLKEPLMGDSFEFTINGKTITASSSDTMRAVIERINSSGAGVKVSYSSITDKFSIEASETGAGRVIDMKDTTGNLLSTMFGIGGGGTVQSSAFIAGKITASGAVDSSDFAAGSSFALTVGGVKQTFNFGSSSDIPFETGVQELNRMLGSTYGTTSEGGETKNNIEIELLKDGDGNVTGAQLVNRSNQKISFDGEPDNLLTKLGFTVGQGTLLKSDSKLTDFGFAESEIINGVEIKANMTAGQLVTDLQTKLGPAATVTLGEDGSFKISSSTELTLTGSGVPKLFGANEVILNKSGAGLTTVQQGQNAKIELQTGTNPDGTPITTAVERATNSFDLDGVFVELLNTTDTAIEIGVTRNTDQILSGIKSFINEYNSLIDTLNSLTSEEASYKKYPPLTAEQKKEMSESEIKLWEEKAKEGLLRGDTIIGGVLSSMRSTLYSKPAGAQFALYDLGITTGEWTQNGKLNITDEAKLKKMIEENASEIEKLFTDPSQGIAVQMNKILDGAAKKSSVSPGSLVNLAGIKGFSSDNNNTLSKQMKSIDQTVENLKRTYESEKTRYWKQFNAMEKIINSMNQQSAWLASQFG